MEGRSRCVLHLASGKRCLGRVTASYFGVVRVIPRVAGGGCCDSAQAEVLQNVQNGRDGIFCCLLLVVVAGLAAHTEDIKKW